MSIIHVCPLTSNVVAGSGSAPDESPAGDLTARVGSVVAQIALVRLRPRQALDPRHCRGERLTSSSSMPVGPIMARSPDADTVVVVFCSATETLPIVIARVVPSADRPKVRCRHLGASLGMRSSMIIFRKISLSG